MAGTIVVDRIESDASYASTINVAGQITFSNTVNFGAFAGTAPVAGFYLPTTNNLAFTTASTERMRIDSAGNVGIGTTSPQVSLKVTSGATGTVSIQSTGTTGTYPTTGSGLELVAGVASATDAIYSYNRNTNAYRNLITDSLTLQLKTSGAEAMRIDSSGNAMIGTTTASGKLHVAGGLTVSTTTTINASDAIMTIGDNRRTASTSTTTGAIVCGGGLGVWSNIYAGGGIFGGDLMSGVIGTTTSNPIASRVNGTYFLSTGFITMRGTNNGALGISTNAGYHFTFYTDNGSTYVGAGVISSTGSTTTYATGSDYRLKENVTPLTGALAKLSLLKPYTWTWKDGNGNGEGFIAHELAEIFPAAVYGEKDAMDENDQPKYQAVDTSFLIGALTAGIQEQQALITSLTARITALESK